MSKASKGPCIEELPFIHLIGGIENLGASQQGVVDLEAIVSKFGSVL